MRIVTVMGSPRRRGNTATVLAWAEAVWWAGGHEVRRYDIVDYIVRGCTGCYACQRPSDGPSCAQDDDGNLIMGEMAGADLTVLATPIYCWGPTAQLKALLDRSVALTHWYSGGHDHLLGGRRVALLATAAGEVEGNADLLLPAHRQWLAYHQAIDAGTLLVPGCGEPDGLGAAVAESAEDFARRAVGESQ